MDECRKRKQRLDNWHAAIGSREVLEEYDAPSWMIDNAVAGVFDPFSSKKVNEHGYNLINHAQQNRLPAEFIRRVQAGEFDAPA